MRQHDYLEAKLDTSTDTKAILSHTDASYSLLSVSDGSKWNKEKTNALVTTRTGNKVMKQVLGMFQIKTERSDVKYKKIYRTKKKMKLETSEGCLIFMTDLLTSGGGRCLIWWLNLLLPDAVKNVHRIQDLTPCHRARLFICLIGRPVKRGRDTFCAF